MTPAVEGGDATIREVTESLNVSSQETTQAASGSTSTSQPFSLESAPKSTLDPGLGNQFKNNTVDAAKAAFDKHIRSGKLSLKYSNSKSGVQSYVNNKSGYSYNIDPGGTYGTEVEGPHIDLNYPNPKPRNVAPKKKLPLKGT